MHYEKAVVRPLGDLYLTVEFGDELDLILNFRVIAFDLALKESRLPGVLETIPTNRSLGIVYDPYAVSRERLTAQLGELEAGVDEIAELPSRHLKMPVWYDDPWSRECAAAHHAPNNLQYMAEINHTTVEGVIAAHSGTQWWCSAVGFQPGTYQAMPLDPAFSITAPKYPRPRKWTPERIVNQAGKITSFYPVPSPGGYQLLGRTPIDLYDPRQRNPVFAEGPVLPKVGDRHTYVPISELEYWEIRREVEAGAYRYDIAHETYRLRDYLELTAGR